MSDRSGKLDAGRASAHQHEGHLASAFFRVIGRFSQFKRAQDLGSDRFSVVEALEARCEPSELVMTEIARTHSRRDHQEVVFEFSTTNSRANGLDGASSGVDALNLGQQHAEVFLFRLKLPDRRRNLGWRQDSGGDLVQERLEDMVITAVDQRYFDIGALERPGRRDTGETAADDQDPFFARDRFCCRWRFFRERLGQNCSHGCTDGFSGPAARLASGFGLFLNGGAMHRTSMPSFHAGAGNTRSNSMRGRISPKAMAMMIRNAVAPFAAMPISRAAGALGPIETNSTTPVAALNRK